MKKYNPACKNYVRNFYLPILSLICILFFSFTSCKTKGTREAKVDNGKKESGELVNDRNNEKTQDTKDKKEDNGIKESGSENIAKNEKDETMDVSTRDDSDSVALNTDKEGENTTTHTGTKETETADADVTNERKDQNEVESDDRENDKSESSMDKNDVDAEAVKKVEGEETRLKDSDRKEGFISGTVYQVYITVYGSSEKDAREAGLTKARQKAFNLLLKDETLPPRLSPRGRQELKTFVEENGEISEVIKESDGTFSIILQIKKKSLKQHLKRLR